MLAVLFLRASGLGLSYLSLTLATRWGGSVTGAAFASFLAWTAIGAVAMHLGWPQVAVRLGSGLRGDELRAHWWHSVVSLLKPGAAAALLGFLLFPINPVAALVGVGSLALALLRVDEGWFRATRPPASAIIGLTLIVPVLTLVTLLSIHATTGLSAWSAAAAVCASTIVVAGSQRVLNAPSRPQQPLQRLDRKLHRSIRTVGISNAAATLLRNADVALAALVLGPNDVVAYALASRLAMVLTQILSATNAVYVPQVAASWNQKQPQSAGALVRRAGLVGALLSMCGALVLALLGGPIAFRAAGLELTDTYRVVLIVLLVAQFVNVSCGPVLTSLNVTGGESRSLKVQLITLAILLVLLAAASITSSIVGLSLATALSLSFSAVALRSVWGRHMSGATQ